MASTKRAGDTALAILTWAKRWSPLGQALGGNDPGLLSEAVAAAGP